MPFYIHIADCNVQCSLWMLIYYITCRTVCAHSPWSPWAPWWSPAAPGPSPWRAPSCGRSTVTTGGPRYSGHEPQSVQSLLQSSSSVNEMWDSTVYYILQETNDEYYLVNIQFLHQTYIYTYLSKQKCDWRWRMNSVFYAYLKSSASSQSKSFWSPNKQEF